MKNALLKTLAALLPTALMLMTPICSQADDYHFADVNRDGEVTLSDVNAVIDVILGHVVDPPQENEDKTFTANGVSFKMVKVKGGMFMMGAADNDTEARPDERPARRVMVSDYYIGETEVTQELWEAVMESQPSAFSGNKKPVERVSWEDCKEFIRRLNTITGQQFRLPTEAEWEFAARGGNKSNGYLYAGSNNISEVAWWGFEKGGNNVNYTTQPVAQLAPNELGLYDMSGNVFEWCNDWYSGYPKPMLYVSPSALFLEDIPAGGNETSSTFTVSGYHLTDDVHITIEGDGFSVNPQVIDVSDANNHDVRVSVSYSGSKADPASAIITVSSKDADDVMINVSYHWPELEVFVDDPLFLHDEIIGGDTIVGGSIMVYGNNLLDDVVLSIDRDDFSLEPSVINPINGRIEGALVAVTYSGTSIEPVSGTITISSMGVPEQSITVVAQKVASDSTQMSFRINRRLESPVYNDAYHGYVDVDPKGPSYGSYHVIRGGSWNVESRFCRNSYRYNNRPEFKHYSIGLRLAL